MVHNQVHIPLCKEFEMGLFRSHLAFLIDVTGGKEPHIQVSVQGTDRHIQFRMIGQDMIGRLYLFNESLIAGRAGCAFDITEDDLAAGIGLFTV